MEKGKQSKKNEHSKRNKKNGLKKKVLERNDLDNSEVLEDNAKNKNTDNND